MAELTPFQTVGPFFHLALAPARSPAGFAGSPAEPRIRIEGSVRDGRGEAVSDALLEFCGAGHIDRAATDERGRYAVETGLPRAASGADRTRHAPHLVVAVFARGILTRLVTRLYFEDEPANAADPVLAAVPAARRETLIARRLAGGTYRFDVVLQGAGETVFFDV
jgi:protocatechuate 3,4-dioxygenase alpha subunit